MKIVALIAGVLLALLGGLWMLQGLGLISVAPIACIGACEPLTGPSILWAIIGGLTIVAGGALVAWARRGSPRV